MYRDGGFLMEASMNNLDMKDFNQLLPAFELAEIKDGFIDRIDLSATGNDPGAQVRLAMEYRGFRIRLLQAQDKPQPFWTHIKSGLINLLLHNKRKVEEMDFYKKRLQKRGAVHFWSQIALEGIKRVLRGKK